MLDRLVRRSVLTNPDRVVGPDVRDGHLRECGDTDGTAHVIREDEERRAEDPEPTVQGHRGQDRTHTVLADTEVQVAAGEAALGDAQTIVDVRVVRWCEVGRAANELGDPSGEPLDHLAAGRARRHALRIGLEDRQLGIPAIRQLARQNPLELCGKLGVRGAVRLELRLPRLACLGATDTIVHVLGHVVRHEELLVLGPAVVGFRQLDFLIAERRTVRVRGVLLVRRTWCNVRAEHDDRRAIVLLGSINCGAHVVEYPTVFEALSVPPECVKALGDVLRKGQTGIALNRDAIVVVDHRDLAEAKMATERGGLLGDAFHQVAVGANAEDAVVDDLVAGAVVALGHHALGECKANHVADALPKRTGRHFNARCVTNLGVPWCQRAPLAKLFEVVERDVVARQVQRRVLEDADVAGRQDKAVAPRPMWLLRVVVEVLAVVEVRDRRERHCGTRVARDCLLHAVHSKRPNRGDRTVGEVGHVASPDEGLVRAATRRARKPMKNRRNPLPAKTPRQDATTATPNPARPRPQSQIAEAPTAIASAIQIGRIAAPMPRNGRNAQRPRPIHIPMGSVISTQPTRGTPTVTGRHHPLTLRSA